MKLNTYKTGFVLGLLFSGVHVVWSLLVILGWAQPLLNFIFWAHMVASPFSVTGFELTNALTLIVVTFAVGFIVGKAFALIWNSVYKK